MTLRSVLIAVFLGLSLGLATTELSLGGVRVFGDVMMPSFTDDTDFPQKMDGGIELLAPIGSQSNVPVTSGLGTAIRYFNGIGEWLITVVVGICVIWVLLGGFQIMLAGADPGMKDRGVKNMTWAIIGLVIVFFAGFILRTLNSQFFT
ncbi:MAG: pilin [Candidatus Peribacteraceae bacterium]|nr:pilin [Candidatus Peribacteraceae bacterium]MDD5075337.1 pilin [Candidatus Peribacteraceae bacterium]